MTNAEWMIKNGYRFIDLLITYSKDGVYKISVCGKSITEYKATNEITYLEIILKWLDMEYEEKILNNAEKKYLSAAIKPFRDRVKYICKLNTLERYGTQRITISFTDDIIDTELPIFEFESETMYKGMELGKKYTPEELEI